MSDVLDEGTIEVTATYGEERHTPVAYNSFSVGPYTMTARVPKAKASAALAWMEEQLTRHAATAREKKARAFLDGLRAVGEMAKPSGR